MVCYTSYDIKFTILNVIYVFTYSPIVGEPISNLNRVIVGNPYGVLRLGQFTIGYTITLEGFTLMFPLGISLSISITFMKHFTM
jgi:hypothetical protein